MAKSPTKAQRREVFGRAEGFCEYCFSPENYSSSTFEIEHILPISKDGKTVLENLALACSSCNKFKSHRIEAVDIETNRKVSLFNPRQDIWAEHFKWSADFIQIIGLSATGRATVQALKLNRKNLQNLRKLLRKNGEHPPK